MFNNEKMKLQMQGEWKEDKGKIHIITSRT
jgi:hypothetical protein